MIETGSLSYNYVEIKHSNWLQLVTWPGPQIRELFSEQHAEMCLWYQLQDDEGSSFIGISTGDDLSGTIMQVKNLVSRYLSLVTIWRVPRTKNLITFDELVWSWILDYSITSKHKASKWKRWCNVTTAWMSTFGYFIKIKGQWLWHSWQGGCFQHQRSRVWI